MLSFNFFIELAIKLRLESSDHMTASINDVTADFARTTCCNSLRVNLNSFSLADHLHKGLSATFPFH